MPPENQCFGHLTRNDDFRKKLSTSRSQVLGKVRIKILVLKDKILISVNEQEVLLISRNLCGMKSIGTSENYYSVDNKVSSIIKHEKGIYL
jgi:CRISPR/Cas system-associated protein Cas5 (RAMP superfamily)